MGERIDQPVKMQRFRPPSYLSIDLCATHRYYYWGAWRVADRYPCVRVWVLFYEACM